MENFVEIAEAFVSNGAGVQLADDRDLDETLVSLVGDPVRRARLGAAARALVEANRGANAKTVAVLARSPSRAATRGVSRQCPSLPSSCLILCTLKRCGSGGDGSSRARAGAAGSPGR